MIGHKEDSLTLLAIRNNETGAYMPHDELQHSTQAFSVPLVETVQLDTTSTENSIVQRVQEQINDRIEYEGVVLQGQQGHMYKLKTLWYTSMAHASKAAGSHSNFLLEALKKRPTLEGIPAKNIWQAILADNADDVVASAVSLLMKAEKQSAADQLQLFSHDVQHGLTSLSSDFLAWCEKVRSADFGGIKEVNREATALAMTYGWGTQLVQAALRSDTVQLRTELVNKLRRLVQASDFEALYHLVHSDWESKKMHCIGDSTATTSVLRLDDFSKVLICCLVS